MKKIIIGLLFAVFSAYSIAAEVLILEEQIVKRNKGKPLTEIYQFSSLVSTGKLVLQTEKVASAKVTLNGKVLLSEKDFKNTDNTLSLPISLLKSNDLEVMIKGKPGAEIRVEAFGEDNNIYDETIVFNSDMASTLIKADLSTGTITFDAKHSQIANASLGSIIAISITPETPNGFLGEITNINYVGEQVIVSTKPTSLFNALDSIDINIPAEFDVQNSQTPQLQSYSSKKYSLSSSESECEGDVAPGDNTDGRACFTFIDASFNKPIFGDPKDNDNNVRIEGRATIKGYTDLVIKAKNKQLELFDASFFASQKYNLSLVSTTSITDEKDILIYDKNSLPKVVFVGYFPIVYQYKLNVDLTLKGSFKGELRTGIEYERGSRGGIRCTSPNISSCNPVVV